MIIIIAGLPGSGKSYFAEKLAARLNAVYINSDQLRLGMQASGKYSFQDKLIVYREMVRQTMKCIEQKKDALLDATFYHHTMREMFLRIAERYNVVIHVIEVIADEDLIRQRLKKPRKFSEADYNVYEKVRDEAEEITMPHLTLESTDENIDFMLNAALDYIANEGERGS